MAVDFSMVSPQTIAVYKQIAKCKEVTVQEIAKSLDIFPNAVYRATKDLTDLGLIEKADTYPVQFRQASGQKAMSLYLQASAKNFRTQFGIITSSSNPSQESLNISLLKNREDMLKREDIDVVAAKQTVDFIVSGLEVPDSTALSFRKAAASGVRIRAIVQQRREASKGRLEKWEELGATVKHLPNLRMRLVIIDQKITYLTSYDPSDRGMAFGVRLVYEPFAIQMSELFGLNWQKAENL